MTVSLRPGSLTTDPAPPLTLPDVAALLAGHEVTAQLPDGSGFPALGDVVLAGIDIGFAPALDSPLVSLAVSVGLADPDLAGWSLFDGLISVHDMMVTFGYDAGSGSVSATVTAEATMAGGTLDAEISLPDLSVDLALAPNTPLDIKQIIEYIAGGSVTMSQVTCVALAVAADVPAGVFRFQALVSDDWSFTVGGQPFALTQVGLDLTYDTALSGQITGLFTICGYELLAVAGYTASTASWSFQAQTQYPITMSLTELAQGLSDDLGLSIDSSGVPADLTLENLNAYYDTGTEDLEITGLAQFDIAGTTGSLGISVLHQQGATTLTGMLFIGAEAFEISFAKGQATVLSGTWSAASDEAALDITDVIRGLGFDPPPIPAGLDLTLTSAQITYDITRSALALTARSKRGAATLITIPAGLTADSVREFYFGLSVGDLGSLGELPVIGDALAGVLQVRGLQVILSSQPLTSDLVKAITPLVPQGGPVPPTAGTLDRIALALTVDIGAAPNCPSASASAHPAAPARTPPWPRPRLRRRSSPPRPPPATG